MSGRNHNDLEYNNACEASRQCPLDKMIERQAQRWFRDEHLYWQRLIARSVPCVRENNTTDNWSACAGYHAKSLDIARYAAAAAEGRMTWVEAKAAFEEADREATAFEEVFKTSPILRDAKEAYAEAGA